MTDTEPLRSLHLPRYDATLTLERSAMYPRTPYMITGAWHGLRYPYRFCASAQEAHDYLDWVEAEYREAQA